MTIRFYDADLSEYVDVPDFQFGDTVDTVRGQVGGETVTGQWCATDRDYVNRTISGMVQGMTQTQAYNLRTFFIDTLEMALSTFFIRFPNNRASESWNQFLTPIYAGATVSGSAVTAGTTYTAGERIPADYIWEGPLRVRVNGLKFTEREGAGGGVFECSITATAEGV